jgi:putative colanic acid biosynthesis acetyltransferase WcaF
MSVSLNIPAPVVYRNRNSLHNKTARVLWKIAWSILYRLSPVPFFWWRRCLLRCFGARIGRKANPYPRARIWAPWNLTMMPYSCLADDVDCYSVASVTIGDFATVSQQAMLCTASHDYNDPEFALITRPIVIGPRAWVGARAFVGPGVKVGEGAVIGAASAVFRDVLEWTVVAGNPAVVIKRRRLNSKDGA